MVVFDATPGLTQTTVTRPTRLQSPTQSPVTGRPVSNSGSNATVFFVYSYLWTFVRNVVGDLRQGFDCDREVTSARDDGDAADAQAGVRPDASGEGPAAAGRSGRYTSRFHTRAVFDTFSFGFSFSFKKRLKLCISLHGNPSQTYGASLGIWDHTVLPATRHK